MEIVLDKKEKLIYSILFSTCTEYEIVIQEYCNSEKKSEFREEIRKIIKKTGITITEDRIAYKDDIVLWKLNFKR